VLFWDQLDWIGVNAFYPLAESGGASQATYVASADRALAQLTAFAAVVDRPVVLVEVGYTTRPDAAVEPWLWPDGMTDVVVDEREQARALAAIAEAAARRPDVFGFFVWRYYANLDDVSQEAAWGFSPHGKLAERALRRIFRRRWAADPHTAPWTALPLAPVDVLGGWFGP
jgi:nucleotide-binding universal stress UspA family protein